MDPLTIFILQLFRGFAFFSAIACTEFGALYTVSPDSARRVSQAINRSALTLDSVLGKQPRVIGGIFLLIEIPLLYITAFMF